MSYQITSTAYAVIKKAVLLYHQNLVTNPERVQEVQDILGVTPETIKLYQIGFCDGSNKHLYPEEPDTLEALKRSLFLSESGEEYFKGSLTIPIYDHSGQLTEIIGVPVDNPGKKKMHLKIITENSFLNWQCFKLHKEIMMTYSYPLFFQAMQKGIRNVVPLVSNFLSSNQIRILQEERIQKICLAFYCSDQTLLKRLAKTGAEIVHKPITNLEKMGSDDLKQVFNNAPSVIIDPSESIISSPEKQKAKKQNSCNKGEPGSSEPLPAPSMNTEKSADENFLRKVNGGFEFDFPQRKYRVLGVKNDFVSVLKVLVKIRQDEYSFFDSLDLYSMRARTIFIKEAVQKLNIGDEAKDAVEKELLQIIEGIEAEREKAFNANAKPVEYVMTETERTEGFKFLKSPDIFDQIDADMTRLGYVGERINKIVTYLVATSRKMESPLASIIVSRSAAGKSKLVETVEKFMPPEDVVSMTASTDQAFYYMIDGMMKHKLVTIGEQEGKATADYPIRELLSRKYLSKAIPVKDRDGNTKTIFIKAEGPVSYIETTTNFNIHPENASRCFQMYIDESEEQTGNVQAFQKQAKTKDYFLSKANLTEVIRKHQSAQRLLKPVLIFNPFVEHIRFPRNKLRTRRDHDKFLNLVEVITFLFQEQRARQKLKLSDGREVDFIESTIEDYRRAYELVSDGILQNTLDDLMKSSKDLLSLIGKMVKETAEKQNLDMTEVIFTRKMVLDFTSWGFSQVRDHIKTLLDFELLEVVSGKGTGQRHQYKLTQYTESANIYASLISSPEEIEQKIKAGKRARMKSSTPASISSPSENLTNRTEPVGLPVSP